LTTMDSATRSSEGSVKRVLMICLREVHKTRWS
jgi:hypothetical protein